MDQSHSKDMKTKNITTANGKQISVYEDVFSYQERSNHFKFVFESLFRVDGSDSNVGLLKDYQIYSNYSPQDIDNMGFLQNQNIQQIWKNHNLNGRTLKKGRVNVSHLGEKNRIHTDGFGVTVLYYVNLEWNNDWSGHTMFLSDDLDECEYFSLYKPGKIVVFDGDIPHCILSPTILSPVHRFSFALQYENF